MFSALYHVLASNIMIYDLQPPLPLLVFLLNYHDVLAQKMKPSICSVELASLAAPRGDSAAKPTLCAICLLSRTKRMRNRVQSFGQETAWKLKMFIQSEMTSDHFRFCRVWDIKRNTATDSVSIH